MYATVKEVLRLAFIIHLQLNYPIIIIIIISSSSSSIAIIIIIILLIIIYQHPIISTICANFAPFIWVQYQSDIKCKFINLDPLSSKFHPNVHINFSFILCINPCHLSVMCFIIYLHQSWIILILSVLI